jgi:hypothetical protein
MSTQEAGGSGCGIVLHAVGADIGDDRHAAGDHESAAIRQCFAVRNHIDGARTGLAVGEMLKSTVALVGLLMTTELTVRS